MNILFLGDVVARSGREAVVHDLPALQREYGADFTIVNGENAAHGKGITKKIYKQLVAAGADVITLGNHAFSKREILDDINDCPAMIRPANMEPLHAGSSCVIKECCGKRIAVINILGMAFMNATAHPIPVMEELMKGLEADIIIVDLHGEATSEKILFARYFSGKVTAVIGTHTHVQIADETIINGCAFITDTGMCGPYDSVLGRDTGEVLSRLLDDMPTYYKPASGRVVICGCLIEVDDKTNRAVRITRIQKRPE